MVKENEIQEEEEVKEDTNTLVAKFQIAQQQLQGIVMQKETLNINKLEIERAMEELGKTKDKTAYKITGNIMVSKPVEELKKDLEETKEAIEIRIKSVEKTEKHLVDQLKGMQERLKKIIK